ncbi:MAG: glycosyltransferase [Kiritimatiellae bacterium]|mgnify:CR=1 FL=1|nr:glycosyltransferase [Kiritimatiellia bacterium]
MKVLWFSPTPSCYMKNARGYNGGGWISSLEKQIKSKDGIKLAIAFFHNDEAFKIEKEGVVYYPIRRNKSFVSRLLRFSFFKREDKKDLELLKKIVDDFNPDLIHIWGTENSLGLVASYKQIPTIFHLQGLMSPCLNAWLPPNYSLFDYFISQGLSPIKILFRIRAYLFNKHAAKREIEILKKANAIMGRTEWDKAYSSLYAPQAMYFHCQEILRDIFYKKEERKLGKKPIIVSTLSGPLYKGHDMVLKTAKVLKEIGLTDFEWRVFGVNNLRFAEKKTKIKTQDVNVKACGVVSAESLKQELLQSTAYVHTSYIDNSPNSVCEALLVGVPVVATNVGGVSSIVKDKHNGFLVPANDPFAAASKILKIINNDFNFDFTNNIKKVNEIAENVLSIYKSLISI